MDWLDKKRDLTTEDLIQVEREFNINLPDNYKDNIKGINGGALVSAYVLVDGVGKVSYSRNVPLNKEAKANIFEIGKYVLKDEKIFFPIAGDGFGNYFCLNLKENTIVFWEHESDKVVYVCDTFTQLLSKIKTK